MAMAGEEPDVIVGCAGGGSNFAGLTFPWFAGQTAPRRGDYRVIAAEPEAAPASPAASYRYDFGDTAQMTPLVKMHTLGHDFIPEPIHAGGLRYHGMAPLVSLLKEQGVIEAQAVHQRRTFEAGRQVRARRGHPARSRADSRHQSSSSTRRSRPGRRVRSPVILFNLCGHGHFDLTAYEQYLADAMEDYELPSATLTASLSALGALPR